MEKQQKSPQVSQASQASQNSRPQPQQKQPLDVKDENFRYIVRISNTDLDGSKKIGQAIRKIKGIGFSFASAVCALAAIDKSKKTGQLADAEIKKIEEIIKTANQRLPVWMLNRRKNIEDNTSTHLVTTDLTFAQENDIRTMKRIKSYRGIRHMAGAPVRGQRTRSNFRKNKGKVLGVVKSKSAASAKGGSEKK